MEVYLDNSSTTKCRECVAELMVKVMVEDYGNPSSMHQKGVDAEKYIVDAGKIIAKELKVNQKEILFTSGGTESNNIALIGTAYANKRKGRHIITTKIEHPSVKNVMLYLEQQGYEITWLSVDENGHISFDELEKSVREDTVLVSIMHVNNEIGSVQQLEKIAKIIKSINKDTYFHSDCVQSVGKFRLYPKKIGVDLLSASAHKFHGPKGIGFLYIGDNVKIQPVMFGGGQQKNIRSGTENVSAIAGMSEAFKLCYDNFDEKMEKLSQLRDYFVCELEQIENVKVHCTKDSMPASYIVSASFIGVRSEVMLHTLENSGIYVSAGSACSSHKRADSDTLKAIGLSQQEMQSNIRFSFDTDTTKEELEYCIDEIKKNLPILRKYQPH